MSDGNSGMIDRHGLTISAELGSQTELLQALLAQERTGILEIAVADNAAQGLTLSKFPVAGAKRVIAHRTGNGTDAFQVPAAPLGVRVLGVNEGRLGGAIVNYGSSAALLYLADAPRAGAAAFWMGPAGGFWDFRLGSIVWCGNVSAAGLGGSTVLTVAEV